MRDASFRIETVSMSRHNFKRDLATLHWTIAKIPRKTHRVQNGSPSGRATFNFINARARSAFRKHAPHKYDNLNSAGATKLSLSALAKRDWEYFGFYSKKNIARF